MGAKDIHTFISVEARKRNIRKQILVLSLYGSFAMLVEDDKGFQSTMYMYIASRKFAEHRAGVKKTRVSYFCRYATRQMKEST